MALRCIGQVRALILEACLICSCARRSMPLCAAWIFLAASSWEFCRSCSCRNKKMQQTWGAVKLFTVPCSQPAKKNDNLFLHGFVKLLSYACKVSTQYISICMASQRCHTESRVPSAFLPPAGFAPDTAWPLLHTFARRTLWRERPKNVSCQKILRGFLGWGTVFALASATDAHSANCRSSPRRPLPASWTARPSALSVWPVLFILKYTKAYYSHL